MKASIGLPMLGRSDARVLVLGTLPGMVALAQQQYYAHKQNSFWNIMGALLGFAPSLPYEDRTRLLLENHIAVWNVLARAERRGSIDANIKSYELNDFGPCFETHRELESIVFNGQEAERLFRRFVKPLLPPSAAALPCSVLPSTSATSARMSFEEKLSCWREAFCR